jgi:acyl-coenzyme A synthetase/AMP-(fatty) acid ligase
VAQVRVEIFDAKNLQLKFFWQHQVGWVVGHSFIVYGHQ